MSKASSIFFRLWAAAVVVTLIFFMTSLWSGPGSIPVVPEQPAKTNSTMPGKTSADLFGKTPEEIKQADLEYVKTPVPVTPFSPILDKYVLMAWSKTGLTQVMDPNPAWTLLPPGTVLEAQLIQRGPDLGTRREDIKISYVFDATTEGILMAADGKPLPREGQFIPAEKGSDNENVFATAVIPALPYSDGNFTPYPLLTIQAHDAAGNLLAETRINLPVSTEMGCKNCHTGDWRVAGQAGISEKTANDILSVHDRINNTELLAQAKAGKEINCKQCHATDNKTGLNLSSAIHGWHASYMTGQGADACFSCHPAGPESATRFADDLHAAKALNCTHCHGYLEDHALSLLNQESKNGKATATRLAEALTPRLVSSREAVNPRTPWENLPSCDACHDFSTKPSTKTASAFNKWTKNKDELYSNSTDDTGTLLCAACHGAPHSLYQVYNPYGRNRSNIPPIQYQSVAAPMGAYGNCAVCHNEPMEMSAHHPLVELKATLISVPEGFVQTKPGVLFPHQGHQSMDCKTCHHTGYVDGQPVSCSTKGCHDKQPTDQGVSFNDPLLLRNAFHGPERGCQTCHFVMLEEGKAAGPTQCRACHTVAKS